MHNFDYHEIKKVISYYQVESRKQEEMKLYRDVYISNLKLDNHKIAMELAKEVVETVRKLIDNRI